MPCFSYKGIDIYGTLHRGKKNIPSQQYLRKTLWNEGIALLSSKQIFCLDIPFLKEQQKILFYKHLGTLLAAGILLPDALEHLALNTKHLFLQNILYDFSKKISAGRNFSSILLENKLLAPPAIHFMIEAGQKSSNLPGVCFAISSYFERMRDFKKNIGKIIIMPAITLCTALILFGIISHTMVNRLITMMHLFNKKGTRIEDRFIFKILNIFTMHTFFMVIGIFIVFFASIIILLRFSRGQHMIHYCISRTPLLRTFFMQSALSQMFFSLGLLLESGVSLQNALSCLSKTTSYIPLKNCILKITATMNSGIMFSAAISQFLPTEGDAAIIMRIAEKTGNIAKTCLELGQNYNNQIKSILQQLLIFLQPLLILILGIIIAGIMIALYTPLLEFSLNI